MGSKIGVKIAELLKDECSSIIKSQEVLIMFRPKFKFTYDEIRIIVLALVELKNQLIAEGRYTDAVDDLLVKFVD